MATVEPGKVSDYTFVCLDAWESRELWQIHMNAPHFAAYAKATDGAVAEFMLNEMTHLAWLSHRNAGKQTVCCPINCMPKTIWKQNDWILATKLNPPAVSAGYDEGPRLGRGNSRGTHLNRIYGKLGVTSRREAARKGKRLGLV